MTGELSLLQDQLLARTIRRIGHVANRKRGLAFRCAVIQRSGGLMVEHDQLVAPQGCRGVRPALIISKLDLEDVRPEDCHNRADLAAAQAVLWHILH